MSYRKQIKKQRRLEQEGTRRSRTLGRSPRNLLIAAGALIVTLAAVVVGIAIGPLSGGASSDSTGPVTAVFLAMQDDYFDPSVLTIKAGHPHDIRLVNEGRNPHNVWLVGPNRTDIRSKDLGGGDTGSFKVKIGEPGEYGFVCTFHAQMGGRLIVEP